MSCLASGSCGSIAKFQARVACCRSDLKTTVLRALRDEFGYDNVVYWVVDEEGRLIEEASLHVSTQIIHAWIEVYETKDPLHCKKLTKNYTTCQVRMLKDVTDVESCYEDNGYYREILRSEGFVDKMVVYFIEKGRCIGGLTFLRKEGERPFEAKDKALLKELGHFITQIHSLKYNILALHRDNNALTQFADLVEDGMMLVDEDAVVHKITAGAERIVRILQGGALAKDSIEEFLTLIKFHTGFEKWNELHNTYCEINNYGIYTRTQKIKGKYFYRIMMIKLKKNRLNYVIEEENDNLTKSERIVLRYIMQGMTNAEIASILKITVGTVKYHITNMLRKRGVSSRTELMARERALAF